MNDYTRQHDLEELNQARDDANSVSEKEKFDKIMYDLKEEDLADEREELVGAVRVGDHQHRKYMERKIKNIELHRKNGRASV